MFLKGIATVVTARMADFTNPAERSVAAEPPGSVECGQGGSAERRAMKSIPVDDVLRSKLANFAVPLAICDESGRVLARVVPQSHASEYEPAEPQIGEDERRRRRNSDQWYTTEQVLDHLRALEQQ